VLEVGIVPQVPTASALPHTRTLKWVYKELGGATSSMFFTHLIASPISFMNPFLSSHSNDDGDAKGEITFNGTML
jgi:hypothetical protein